MINFLKKYTYQSCRDDSIVISYSAAFMNFLWFSLNFNSQDGNASLLKYCLYQILLIFPDLIVSVCGSIAWTAIC